MKAYINIQEVEVQRIRIDYIQPQHKSVQTLIKYCNAIPTVSKHKIYNENISLEPPKMYSYSTITYLSLHY